MLVVHVLEGFDKKLILIGFDYVVQVNCLRGILVKFGHFPFVVEVWILL